MASRVFLLDRSGSMETCWDDTIGGYNSFISDQAVFGGTVTLVQFDHEYSVTYNQKPIGEVVPLNRTTYQPRGSTALLDAIGRTIKAWTSPDAPTIIVLTDGVENSSQHYTKGHIKDLIESKTKDGWTFVYLGANQDAFSEAGSIGIGPTCTMNFDGANTPDAFTRLSAAMSQQASNPSQTLDLGN
jgi:hypothetical protein